jgi:lipopolysaccharide/colanic/teichoic acid biosynthesis glycosyltransferase
MGSPVLFRQRRAGRGGVPFTVLKLRTMLTPEQAGTVDDAARLTPLGRTLRSFSLDELPQLVNVIAGEMSLVGPRPLPLAYVPRYSPAQRRRLDVRPGVTGLAQVTGRNSLSWDERFALDVEYVERHDVWLDLRLLWRTVGQVLRRDGIAAEGHATMHEFLGPQGSAA